MSAKPMTAAAAIMASNPSRQNAPSPTPTPAAKLPGSQSQLTELEPELPVESLKVDSLALMKIIKHAREVAQSGTSSPAAGQILGIDSAGVLNVSDAFPLPSGSLGSTSEGEDKQANQKSTMRYTASILPRLSALGADANVVGFYCSTVNGQHCATPGFIENLISMQIGLPPAANPKTKNLAPVRPKLIGGKGVALVYDLASAAEGTIHLKAYRLSKEFVETYKAGVFDSQNLANHKLTTSNFLQEIPLKIQSSALLTAFLATLIAPTKTGQDNSQVSNGSWGQTTNTGSTCKLLDFLPSFTPLGTPSSACPESPLSLSDSLAATITSIDTHNTALSTLSFQIRQLARDRARLESVINKRKADNETRAQQGLPPLPPSAEEASLKEPSRLESMCALSGVDSAAKKLTESSGLGVVRAFGAKAGVAN
ncbi:eukaryotic translation initiation factor 3 subunit H [Puccinia sorghi]|uniref:Eukaryotic translation initiation factor 3 subunit H n=1 Tax=Puccinia sorghi TaxID=27349 RepID=A0A0L6V454_9BASI|nr:eukaryotic translation initiation factor 3 subunit H [Puccinia sorghi]